MLKNFIFSALLLNMIATYLSFKEMKKSSSKKPFYFTIIGIVLFVIMAGLTIDLFFSPSALLLNAPILLWFLLLASLIIEVVSIIKKIIPGQFIAASLLLFLVLPTIFSIGVYLLIIVIIMLLIAFITFQKSRDLGLK